MQTREKRIALRLDGAALSLLEAEASRIGLNVSTYVRMAALEKAREAQDRRNGTK